MTSRSFDASKYTDLKATKSILAAQRKMATLLMSYVDESGSDNDSEDDTSKKRRAPVRKQPPRGSRSKRTSEAIVPMRTSRTSILKRSAPCLGSDGEGEAETLFNKKRKTSHAVETLKVSSKSTNKGSPSRFQKHTGRFRPIGSQLKRPFKIEPKVTSPYTSQLRTTLADNKRGEVDSPIKDKSGVKITTHDTTIKSQAQTKAVVHHAYESTASEDMASTGKPENAILAEPWNCAERNCKTGQTWYHRDGANGFGRKVISNFFGRNKSETNRIHIEVWHMFCRKDYQRGKYRAELKSNPQPQTAIKWYISNVRTQLLRIKLWRSEAKFKVCLTKGATDRVNNYIKELHKNGLDMAKAMGTAPSTPNTAKAVVTKSPSLEETFPANLLYYFDDNFSSKDSNQTFHNLELILQWIEQRNAAGELPCMPPMQFLINAESKEEAITDPGDNYKLWTAYEDERADPGVSHGEQCVDHVHSTESSASVTSVTSPLDKHKTIQINTSEIEAHTSDELSSELEESATPPSSPIMPRQRFMPSWPGARPAGSTFYAAMGSGRLSQRGSPAPESSCS